MSGAYKTGFTLIEVLVAVALLALLATIVVPKLGLRSARVEREQFVAKFNALMQLAWQNALTTNKLHKIDIDFAKGITVLVENGKDEQGKRLFKEIKTTYLDAYIAWPRNFQAKNFYIDGKDAMEEFTMKSTGEVWFYLVPEGVAQEIILNAVDTKDMRNNKPRSFSLVLNPFSSQFSYYDTFQK